MCTKNNKNTNLSQMNPITNPTPTPADFQSRNKKRKSNPQKHHASKNAIIQKKNQPTTIFHAPCTMHHCRTNHIQSTPQTPSLNSPPLSLRLLNRILVQNLRRQLEFLFRLFRNWVSECERRAGPAAADTFVAAMAASRTCRCRKKEVKGPVRGAGFQKWEREACWRRGVGFLGFGWCWGWGLRFCGC
jgi:hypothetical protein